MRIFWVIPSSSYKTLKKGQTQTNIKKKKKKKKKSRAIHLDFQCLTVVCYAGLCLEECWHDPLVADLFCYFGWCLEHCWLDVILLCDGSFALGENCKCRQSLHVISTERFAGVIFYNEHC